MSESLSKVSCMSSHVLKMSDERYMPWDPRSEILNTP
jgi:hypothetical protein